MMKLNKTCLYCGKKYDSSAVRHTQIVKLNPKTQEFLGTKQKTIEALKCPHCGGMNIRNDLMNRKYHGMSQPGNSRPKKV